MARPIVDSLRHLQGGTFLDEASDRLAELVSAVDNTGKAGKITLEISVKKLSKGAMAVVGKISLCAPQEAPESTLMFPTPEGNLLTEDPRQQKLTLKTVEAMMPVELKQVGVK